jgi:hypothetical protein
MQMSQNLQVFQCVDNSTFQLSAFYWTICSAHVFALFFNNWMQGRSGIRFACFQEVSEYILD